MSLIVILNGASSAGKTSLARAVQNRAAQQFIHVQMDTFIDMLPPRLDNHVDGFVFHRIEGVEPVQTRVETGQIGRRLLYGMRGAVRALADAGNDVIVDDVWMAEGEQATYAELLIAHDVHYVGVHASLDVLVKREVSRGDRDIGLARWLLPIVHQNTRYDLELDTGAVTSEQAAQIIVDRFAL